MDNILDGRSLSKIIKTNLEISCKKLLEKNIFPYLVILMVGEDIHSKKYVEMKANQCQKIGVNAKIHFLPSNYKKTDLIKKIQALNTDSSVHGILLQLPLPPHLDENEIISYISETKDVDGLLPISLGNMFTNKKSFVSAGALACLSLINHYKININTAHSVILGSSNIFCKPLLPLLLNHGSYVTLCNDISNINSHKIISNADLLFVDVQSSNIILKNMVKKNVVVFDAGNNYVDGKLTGDVDFNSVKEIASWITPVPGGIGPLLIMMLIKNVLQSANGQKHS